MANVTYLTDCIARLVAMEKEAVVGIHPEVDAVPYTFHIQTRGPWWTNTLAGYSPAFSSEDLSVRPYLWRARYHIGFKTEGNFGDMEAQLLADLPYIENFFMEHIQMSSTLYPTAFDQLDPVGISINVSQGLTEFPPVTGDTPTLGTIIEVITPFNITIAQQD